MGNGYFTNPLVFLLEVTFGLYIAVLLLRFWLQQIRANFYNPLSQAIVTLTNPPLRPLRRLIPGWGKMDVASLLLAYLLQLSLLILISLIQASPLGLGGLVVLAVAELIGLALNILLFSIFIIVILSWVSPGSYNPSGEVFYSIAKPVLAPISRALPPVAGLDFSPMVAMVLVVLAKMLIIPPFQQLALQVG
jgi:YggT family protein